MRVSHLVLPCILVLGVGALIAVTLASYSGAVAYQEMVLHSFCAQKNCTDGDSPQAELIMDAAGNLYGTTTGGGAHECGVYCEGGTVFELIPNATKTAWTETVLYSFCAQKNCADGDEPRAGVIMDSAGNLYGTTHRGGADGNYGTVFELTPNATRTGWMETVLYSFASTHGATPDGRGPRGRGGHGRGGEPLRHDC